MRLLADKMVGGVGLRGLHQLCQLRVTDRRTRKDFREFLGWLADDIYPQAQTIVLVVDNLNTHGPAALYEAFAPEQVHRLAKRFE